MENTRTNAAGRGEAGDRPGWRKRLSTLWSQMKRFTVCGVGSFLTDFIVFSALAKWAGVHALVANLLSRPAGGVFGFFVNKYWTFAGAGRSAGHVQFARFWVLWVVTLCASEFLLAVFHQWFDLGPLTSKLLAELLVSAGTFVAHKYWTFR